MLGIFCRIFEDVKEELMNLYQEREALEIKTENESYDKVSQTVVLRVGGHISLDWYFNRMAFYELS